MYRSIFIDLDDTLWHFKANAYDTFYEMYVKYSFNRYFDSFDHFYTLYQKKNQELWVEYGDGKITKEELNSQRFLYPLEAVGVSDAVLAKRYSDDFFSVIPTKSQLLPYAKEALDYLSLKYRLFILSNGFRELQFQKMHSSGIFHYFEKVILSEDIHVHKPYPEIFNFALSSTQSLLEESLMIGDSWEADIVGAKGVGMHQMFYNYSGRKDLQFQPTYTIKSLNDILSIL
ncbi:YjjG family noncanonical pyrimidine nucleotidase [uncultured Bacteroides sp.]|uniref:YjjG family noncanonical pyrimidine nucleotidase n=1 Tax=uncultured Bacteroides sp. TaxID=162156 RepID=UPI002AAB85A9|nr:YjjG family noncanonical pyrimidine nucleotidase [uncultured Bacteroides sp.]